MGGVRRETTSLFSVRRVDLEFEVLPLPHIADGVVAKRVESLSDGGALGIENRRLEGHEHASLHQTATS